MTNTAKNLKRRLKAPRNLVEATKRGERLSLTYSPDSRAIHVRRFSKALIAYACVVALLLGSVTALWMLIDTVGLPASKPTTPSTTTNPPLTTEYIFPSLEEGENYVCPHLIWGNERNPWLENTVIWSAEIENGQSTVTHPDGQITVTHPLTIPDVGIDNARYAVELRVEPLDGGELTISEQYMLRKIHSMKTLLENAKFEKIEFAVADGASVYHSSVYSAGAAELNSSYINDLALYLLDAPDGVRVTLRIAWQSCNASAQDSTVQEVS